MVKQKILPGILLTVWNFAYMTRDERKGWQLMGGVSSPILPGSREDQTPPPLCHPDLLLWGIDEVPPRIVKKCVEEENDLEIIFINKIDVKLIFFNN